MKLLLMLFCLSIGWAVMAEESPEWEAAKKETYDLYAKLKDEYRKIVIAQKALNPDEVFDDVKKNDEMYAKREDIEKQIKKPFYDLLKNYQGLERKNQAYEAKLLHSRLIAQMEKGRKLTATELEGIESECQERYVSSMNTKDYSKNKAIRTGQVSTPGAKSSTADSNSKTKKKTLEAAMGK